MIYFESDFKNTNKTNKKVVAICGKQKVYRTIYKTSSNIEFFYFKNNKYVVIDKNGNKLKPFPFDTIKFI